MNALILAIIKMLQTLRSVVKANEAKFTVVPAFTATFTEVKDLLTEIEALQKVASDKTKSTTKAVLALKKQLALATIEVCTPMKGLANKLKDSLLLDMVSVSPSELKGMKPSILTTTCQKIYDKATELKTEAANYGLTEKKRTDMETLLKNYSAQYPEVRKLTGEINTSKRDIDSLVNETLEILEGQLDPMVASLRDTDATAVELWTSARHVVKPQRTPTQLKVRVVTPSEDGNEKLPLPDARFIASNGKDHTAVTDELGFVLFKPLPFGTYDLKCEVPGFEPFLVKKYKVVRGNVNEVEVVLKRAA
ncbi:MAG: carboxypeptidase regulatory-like domain-containing protein [Saprospiraceae bacterium]|nr:carboxypeptidase regulatory-like domain-containing protein [Saprospiraceae bacterium]